MVVVLIVADGMIQGISSRIIELASYHVQVRFAPYAPQAANAVALQAFAALAECAPSVAAAYGERQGVALAASSAGRSGASVRAVDGKRLFADEAFSQLFSVREGALAFADSRCAVIGEKIAETLELHTGDTLRLITMQHAGGRMVPRVAVFTVSGIVSCGYQELDALWVFIPLETGFSFLPDDASTTFVGIRSHDAFNQEELTAVRRHMQPLLPAGSTVYSWSQLNSAQFENFASTKIMLLFIMFLIVLVASVNVSSALVMLVMEKRREIAILKSVGASPAGIMLSFLLVGFLTGLFGVCIGIPLGLLCGVNINELLALFERIVNTGALFLYSISGADAASFVPMRLLDPAYYLQSIPVMIPLGELFVIASGTLLLSVIMSIIPSMRAAWEKPIATLRKV